MNKCSILRNNSTNIMLEMEVDTQQTPECFD